MNHVSESMREHYEEAFSEHGANYRGVDSGGNEENGERRLELRYENMARLIEDDWGELQGERAISILDVGCGYGGLYDYLVNDRGMANVAYTGVDLCENMIAYARERHPECNFFVGDILEQPESHEYDYVVCNGVLTAKLENSIREMDRYAKGMIDRMWAIARRGIAFNIMKSQVDFMNENCYYKSPLEALGYCMTLTDRFVVDCSYPLYEYTVYLYKPTRSM